MPLDERYEDGYIMKMANEDPWVMYLIVNQDLNMSAGKACAQVGHGVEYLVEQFYKMDRQIEAMFIGCDPKKIMDIKVPPELALKCDAFTSWRKEAHRKVVLKANSKEFEKLKEEYKDNMVLVRDAGYTEVPEGSETVIGLWPIRKSQASKLVQRLQTLK